MDAIYIAVNQFRITGDKTAEFNQGRRVKLDCGVDGVSYSTVDSSTFSDPYTTITIKENSITTNISDVKYGVVSAGDLGSIPDHLHDGSEGSGGSISVSGTGGAYTLLDLTDTPDSYDYGKYLRSTASGTEWEIVPDEDVTTFSGLTDTPDSYDDGKYLRSTTSGTEWSTVSTDHSALSNLDYASSGHTGFASSASLNTISGSLQAQIDTLASTSGSLWSDGEGVPDSNTVGDYYIDTAAGSVYKKTEVGLDSVKSIVIDIADSQSDAYVGVRSVEFYLNDVLLSITSVDFTAYNTSAFPATSATYVFDTSKSKIDGYGNNAWMSTGGSAPQRIICVFNTATQFDSIVINNHHNNGGETTRGAKNVKIHKSDDAISDTTYNAAIGNSTLIFDSTWDAHVASNVADDDTLTIDGHGAYVSWSEVVSTYPSFTGLTDTPSTYSGIEGNYLRVTSSGIQAVDGIILTAPDSGEWLIKVTNSGTLYTEVV